MFSVFRDMYSVLWVDLRFLRRHWLRTLATSLVNPILYLVAFGYGLGRGISFEGFSYLAFVMPGIIALTAMNSSYGGAGLKLHVDRLFYKCFEEYLLSPISLFSETWTISNILAPDMFSATTSGPATFMILPVFAINYSCSLFCPLSAITSAPTAFIMAVLSCSTA